MKRNLRILTYLLILNFIIVLGTMTYWQVYKKDEIALHPRNKRLGLLEARTERGRLLDREGAVIAESKAEGSKYIRVFPQGEVTAHLVGYNSVKYGKAGLEYSLNAELLGLTGREELLPFLPDLKEKRTGYQVTTTIDLTLQQLAYRLLGNNRGAVVVVQPETGAVLALVSKPSYNPNLIEQNWAELQQEGNGSPLLNRATQGLYPPGSTLKVVTGAGALNQNPDNWERIFEAPGYIVVRGNRINDERVVGKISFKESMQRSSNYVFATLGLELGAQRFHDTMRLFGLTGKIDLDIPTTGAITATAEELSPEALAETAIGQGKTLVTPLQMALVAATVANDGRMPKPHLVSSIKTPEGTVIGEAITDAGTRLIEADINQRLTEAMQAVVDAGTGRSAAVSGIKVAGKTGSAQNPHGDSHAWFIGFAPVEKPQLAVAVVVENGGAGGTVAAPIARELFKAGILSKR